MGGLCFVCLNRVEPGVIHHIDHGQVVLGEFDREPEPRTHEIASMFRAAGVPCKVTDNLTQTHWEKLVWNIPFNGLGVAGVLGYEALATDDLGLKFQSISSGRKCMTTEDLLSDARWTGLAKQLMLEIIAAAQALGLKIKDSLADKQIERTRTMGAYKASTLVDFEKGLPLELNALFLEPLRQARGAGVHVPRLESLARALSFLSSGG
jgi:2-dehydropantoate 2-reductase